MENTIEEKVLSPGEGLAQKNLRIDSSWIILGIISSLIIFKLLSSILNSKKIGHNN